MILIDPPRWPAHGTLFSHLVSDSSLTELHAFAQANNISQRAFDLDHYDVPAEFYNRLVCAGATATTGAELTRRLIASGLRIPLKERPSKIRGRLQKRFTQLLPHSSGLAHQLLDRWQETHRTYHNSAHLLEMLVTLDRLYSPHKPPRAVLLAAWFHDAVYTSRPGQDEQASAELANNLLTPLVGQAISAQELTNICGLIELTAEHIGEDLGKRKNHADLDRVDSGYFLDSDLAILAADRARYERYMRGVEQEYAHLSPPIFEQGRLKILKNLLTRDSLFSTRRGRELYEEKARANLHWELKLRTIS